MRETPRLRWAILIMTCLGCLGLGYFVSPHHPRTFADEATQFQLPASDGKLISLPAENPPAFTVLCFLGAECPLAKLYAPRLQKLAETYGPKGVSFVGIDSNRQDSREDVQAYVEEHGLSFPVVKDYDNKAADHFQATRTPEVVVLDAKGGIRYRGRVDDQFQPGIARTKPTRNDLEIALKELVAGKQVSVAKTEPAGCLIGKVPQTKTPTDVTYSREVSRILKTHCVECHREGEIGPFSLTDYDEVIGWGEMMLEVIDQGRMPPWHANPKYGHFANARHMPESDKQTLREWVAGGMPFGNEKELPALYESTTSGWQLPRKPDQILVMNKTPFAVPADGVVEYQYFVVDPKFAEDKWITGAQVIPGNPAVVHHCIVFIRPPDGADSKGVGFLTGYVPGQRTAQLREGRARRVPVGSRLVFQMHYTPTGTPQSDLTKIGLLFAEESEITHEVVTLTALNRDFEIPPRHANYPVSGGTSRIPENGELLAITPHMHYRGKSFRVMADAKQDSQILLDVPYYDFNWQHIYELREPLPLDNISKLRFTAHFDNSAGNPFNPDPSRHITWGDQTWEEMAIAFFEVAYPRGEKPKPRSPRKEVAQKSPEQTREIADFVEKFFKRFDENGDGVIRRTEMPLSQQRFGFRQFDRNDDGVLDREEIEAHAQRKF